MEGRQMFMILAPNPRMLQAPRDRARAAGRRLRPALRPRRAPGCGPPRRARPPPRRQPAPGQPRPPAGGRPHARAPKPRPAVERAETTEGTTNMPKLKTKSGAKKRFQVKKSGKVKFRRAGEPPPGHLRQDQEAEAPPAWDRPPDGHGREEDQGELPVRPVGHDSRSTGSTRAQAGSRSARPRHGSDSGDASRRHGEGRCASRRVSRLAVAVTAYSSSPRASAAAARTATAAPTRRWSARSTTPPATAAEAPRLPRALDRPHQRGRPAERHDLLAGWSRP